MITNMISQMQAINTRYSAQNTMFGAQQKIMDLAGGATANMSQGDILSLQQQEKTLMMQNIQAQVQFQAAMLMQEAAQKRMKADFDLKRRLMDAGATFV